MSRQQAIFEASWIKSALGGNFLQRGTAAAFEAIVTDSRKAAPGTLFVAIRGENFDGHDFVESAIRSGAAGVLGLTSRLQGIAPRFPSVAFFGVESVQDSYRALASAWRNRFAIPVILVAGSNGKTTTKELLAALLRGKWGSVLKTQGSQNGFLGIPMSLLELRAHHAAAVIEVGIDDVGAMLGHVDCVRPTHAVLTVIGPEHLENLKDIPTVAREELIALSQTRRLGGKIAINLDDPWIAPAAADDAGLTFSLEKTEAAVRGRIVPASTGAGTLEVTAAGRPGFELPLPLPGRHNAQNLLAAASVALLAGLEPAEIQKGIATFEGAEGRSQIRTLPPSRQVICDYYNASPVSMKAAFDLLTQTGDGRAKKWACLADMKELGPEELRFHRELAPGLLAARPAGILLHGPRMQALADELKDRKFAGVLEHYDSPEELARALAPRLGTDDVVLIKGSRSMKMEKVWQTLNP